MAYSLGVDLGTTFAAAAIWRDDRSEIVMLDHHRSVIPSVLFLRDDGEWLVGEPAARRGLSEPGRVAREFKRRFGDTTPIILGGSPWSADALTARLLRYIVDAVTEQEGEAPDRVTVTHPANWGPYKTDLLRQATRDDSVLVSEPEAAAIHYASTAKLDPGDVVVVFDLGGGTFDAAVLEKTAAGFTFRGTPEGIERLGGIDFDEAVLAHVTGFVGAELNALDPNDPQALSAMARLRDDCVQAKEALSADTEVSIPVLLPNVQTEIRLTRAEFEAMIRPTLAETIDAMGRALRSGHVDAAEVKAVLLVGGSSRIPLVGQLVAAEIGRPVAVDVHPKHAVALGAARPAVPAATPAAGGLQAVPPVPAPAASPDPSPASAAPVAPVAPAAPAAPVPTGARRRARGSRVPLIAAGAAAIILAGAVGGYLLTRGSGGTKAPPPVRPDVPTFQVDRSAQSMVAGAGSLWFAGGNGTTVTRFDKASQRISVELQAGKTGTVVALAYGGAMIWAVNADDGNLYRIDPTTNSVTGTAHVGKTPHDAIVANGFVWVTVSDDGVLARVNPKTMAVTPVIIRGRPWNVISAFSGLWITDTLANQVVHFDPNTNAVVADTDTGGCPDYLTATTTQLWLQDECKVNTVFEVDPDTGKVINQVTVGKDAKGILFANDAVWVANSSDATVSRIDVATGAVSRTVKVENSPGVLASDGATVWVLNNGSGSLSRLE